jgi:hypothetical protein
MCAAETPPRRPTATVRGGRLRLRSVVAGEPTSAHASVFSPAVGDGMGRSTMAAISAASGFARSALSGQRRFWAEVVDRRDHVLQVSAGTAR